MSWSERTRKGYVVTYLLKEDSGFLLQENGDKLVLSYGDGDWNKRTRLTIDDWSERTRPIT